MQEVRIKAVLANDLMSADSLYRELLFNNLTQVINIDINNSSFAPFNLSKALDGKS